MIVKVDPDLCIGCGLCINTVPGVFEMDEDKAVAKSGVVDEADEESARQMVEDCPVNAISIE